MRSIRKTMMLLAALVMVIGCSITAFAEDAVEVSTTYPGISAKAGESVSFNLDFNNSSEKGVYTQISVASMPDGWTGYIEGNSKEISSIYVKPGENKKSATLNVNVAEDAKNGNYEISVKTVAEGITNILKVTVTVKDEQLGGNTLKTDYTDQEGTLDTTYKFSTTISNNSAEDISYNFDATLPDSGWQISYKPSGGNAQVSGITVAAKEQQVMNIAIIPSVQAAAGTYEIPIRAISTSDTLEDTFVITIKGKYDAELTTPSGNLNVETNAKKKTAVTLNINNTGNIALENVNLSSKAPEGWTVEFSESTIDYIEAGATKEVTAYITPSGEAMNGDYITVITASAGEINANAQFRVTVKTETLWGIVGVVLIVIALAGLGWVFRKYGRR